ncbi:MAG: type IV toxin-antitoxin system AbiEi family antitoxin domain-containing protein [Acidobacteriota bacterium]
MRLFTTTQARAEGISAKAVGMMSRRGAVDRVSHGVYRFVQFPMTELGPFMEAVLWPLQATGVLSHDSALRLYALSDANPGKIHITLPVSFRVRREVPEPLMIHGMDLGTGEWHSWEGIPVTTPRRTITDCAATGLGPELIGQAIEDGFRKGLFSLKEARQLKAALI